MNINNKDYAYPNRLTNEQSPYLLQHAYNPVDWYPWGDEAFNKAKEEDKPVFLSIGYSTCHWCHVMADESFEDQDVADVLNEHFVSVKVDREERPDIDSVYMSVCQSLTGRGGWPLTIIMFPDQKPFFAGTYLPKNSKYGMSGIIDVLETIVDKWNSDRDALSRSSKIVTDALNKNKERLINTKVTDEVIPTSIKDLSNRFDKIYGGFSNAPKFPTPHILLFLMNHYYQENRDESLEMVEETLQSMFKGGLFDHIGYGFSRYSTDEKWLVPHFEKMLYDNALLTIAYLEAFQITNKHQYKEIAEMIMTYVERELKSDKGGFYCAQDADSEGEEGKYYVFRDDEVRKTLGPKDGEEFNQYYNISSAGNFEGKNIANLLHHKSEDLFAPNKSLLEDDKMKKMKKKLYDYRLKRTTLHKDDKILTSWNSLMIVAFTKAYKVLQDDKYLKLAEKSSEFIQKNLVKDGKLLVVHREGVSKGSGHIDDYAFYIWALIELYETTFEIRYLENSLHFYKIMMEDFFDEDQGGFYLYGKTSERLIARPKEVYDGAMPSGNSVALYAMIKLSELTANMNIRKASEKQVEFVANKFGNYPSSSCFALIGIARKLYPTKELVCVTDNKEDIQKIQDFMAKHYLPNLSVIIKTPENSSRLEILAPFTKDYEVKDDKPTFYLCENHVCLAPFNKFSELEGMIIHDNRKRIL